MPLKIVLGEVDSTQIADVTVDDDEFLMISPGRFPPQESEGGYPSHGDAFT
jgi:hypothetical protein